jgi:hypothetical protein
MDRPHCAHCTGCRLVLASLITSALWAARGNAECARLLWPGAFRFIVHTSRPHKQLQGVSLRYAAGRALVLRIELRCADLAPSGFHPDASAPSGAARSRLPLNRPLSA